MSNKRNILFAAVAAALSISGAVEASTVNSAVAVIDAPPVTGSFSFDRTIDQSGLSHNYVSGVTDYTAYTGLTPTHTRNNSPANYAASFALPVQTVDYDLGAAANVEGLLFWNYPFQSPGGVTAFDMIISSVSDFSASTLVGSFNPANDGDGTANNMQLFDSTDLFGRYVRISVTGVAGGGMGWSEIAFRVGESVAPIPVPATLPLLLGALGCFGFARRFRSV